MKILYLTDHYGAHNRGTKPSIFLETKRRGFDIHKGSVHTAGGNKINGQALLQQIRSKGFTWVWIAHSWSLFVGCTLEDIHKAGARVLGFGFSDPYHWIPAKLDQYDAYATNHYGTYDKLKGGDFPVTTIITAGDSAYHQDLGLVRDIDILVFGVGDHLRFNPRNYRIALMLKLLERYPGLNVKVYGKKWGAVPTEGYLGGDKFKEVINRSRLALDLQQPHAPLAHRMFECLMCGTPIITRNRPEVERLFGDWAGLGCYENEEGLWAGIEAILGLDTETWTVTSNSVRQNTLQNHDIGNRLDNLLAWFNEL